MVAKVLATELQRGDKILHGPQGPPRQRRIVRNVFSVVNATSAFGETIRAIEVEWEGGGTSLFLENNRIVVSRSGD